MRMRSIGLVMAVLLVLFLPDLAWAVANVSVTVSDAATGKAVPDATITISGVEGEFKTDSQGHAQIPVDLKGKDEERRTIVVAYGGSKRSRPIDLREGQTTRVDFSLPVAAALPSTPVSGLGTVAAGPSGRFGRVHMDLGRERRQTETINIGSSTISVTEGTSSGRDFTLDFGAGALQVPVGLPSFPVVGDVRANPWVNVSLGGASATVHSDSNQQPQTNHNLETSGVAWGAGVNLVLSRPDSPWWAGAGYNYWGAHLSGERNPCAPPGTAIGTFPVVSCSSDVNLTYEEHQFSGRFGYNIALANLDIQVSPYAGAGYTRAHINNETKIQRTVDLGGTLADVADDIDQKIERAWVEGIVGLAVRVGAFLGQVETRFNDCDVSVFFRLMVGFDFGGGNGK